MQFSDTVGMHSNANPNSLVGVRDPYGIRPLVIGKLNSYVLASETCALDIIGANLLEMLKMEKSF